MAAAHNLSQGALAMHHKLKNDFKFYAQTNLKIVDKIGNLVPFRFNSAQEYIHEKLEEQKRLIGKVRAFIVKGRQQGASTYVTGRFYKLASTVPLQTISILSHEAKASENLKRKVDNYYEHSIPQLRHSLKSSSTQHLELGNGSRYGIFTAGSKNSGRSQTAQYLHCSEEAYFECDESLMAGIFQIVPDLPGTEIIRESTGNGMNGFYKAVREALKPESEWIVIFVPWFWQIEYRKPVRHGFKPTDMELELVATYGLDFEQLQWRRDKIEELKSERLFKQEYPNTLTEAFQAPGSCFYNPDRVARARRNMTKAEAISPVVIGVDPARDGDRTVIVIRQGRVVLDIIKYERKDDTMDSIRLAGIVGRLIDQYKADKCFIDYGLGYGTVDQLIKSGYGRVVQGVHFQESPIDPQFLNKRAEMAFEFRDWLEDIHANLPDDDDMAADIASMPDFEQSSNGKLKFPDKAKIRKMYGQSPDILDAIMLTFAYPVGPRGASNVEIRRSQNTKRGSGVTTLARMRGQKNGFRRTSRIGGRWFSSRRKRFDSQQPREATAESNPTTAATIQFTSRARVAA